MNELRFALRMLRKNSAFTAVAVITLALGIGVNTAIFSVVHAVLLRSIPYPEPERLVLLQETIGKDKPASVSYPNFLDWQKQNQVFDEIASFSQDEFSIAGGKETERVSGELVSDNYFRTLGVAPAKGRAFRPDENLTPGAHPVAVLSWNCWQHRYASDPNLVGKTVRINESEYTIVGIMPEGFQGFSGDAELWIPMIMSDTLWPYRAQFDFLHSRDIHWHRSLGRLKPEITLERARADMDTIGARLASAYPRANATRGVRITPATKALTGTLRSPLLLLLGSVFLILMIASVNVANLMLARSISREREIAIRAALGAGRKKLILQLLTESTLLAALGGSLGFLLAVWGIDLLISILPVQLPSFVHVQMDPRVLGFTCFVSLTTGIVLGLVPALRSSRPDLNTSLKTGTPGSGERHGNKIRSTLVITQMALALMLMIGAGLMIRSFQQLSIIDPGFRPDHLVTLRFEVPNKKYQGEQRFQMGTKLLARIQTVSGVRSAGLTNTDLFLWGGITRGFTLENHAPISPAEQDTVYFENISPNFLDTMGIPLLKGRDVTIHDDATAPGVAIVSDAFARRYWPEGEAIGKRFKYGPSDSKASWITITGIAKDVRSLGLRNNPENEPVVYTPLLQSEVVSSLSLVVRTLPEPSAMLETLRGEIGNFDPDIPVYSISTVQQRFVMETMETRSYALLMSLFAGLAMLLSVVGIYGVMAYSVIQRRKEMGIRLALGAQRADLLRMVLGSGLRLSMIGAAIGIGGALALSRLLTGLLFGIRNTDPFTFVLVPVFLVITALIAGMLPAIRAATVDPLTALRYE